MKEVQEYRQGNENTLLVYDGYGCQIQYRVLKLLEENGIIVIRLPANSSSELQPPDKTVLGPFKAPAQSFLNSTALATNQLDTFHIELFLNFSYSPSFTLLIIQIRFQMTRIWDWDVRKRSVSGQNYFPLFSGGLSGTFPRWNRVLQDSLSAYRTQ